MGFSCVALRAGSREARHLQSNLSPLVLVTHIAAPAQPEDPVRMRERHPRREFALHNTEGKAHGADHQRQGGKNDRGAAGVLQ